MQPWPEIVGCWRQQGHGLAGQRPPKARHTSPLALPHPQQTPPYASLSFEPSLLPRFGATYFRKTVPTPTPHTTDLFLLWCVYTECYTECLARLVENSQLLPPLNAV